MKNALLPDLESLKDISTELKGKALAWRDEYGLLKSLPDITDVGNKVKAVAAEFKDSMESLTSDRELLKYLSLGNIASKGGSLKSLPSIDDVKQKLQKQSSEVKQLTQKQVAKSKDMISNLIKKADVRGAIEKALDSEEVQEMVNNLEIGQNPEENVRSMMSAIGSGKVAQAFSQDGLDVSMGNGVAMDGPFGRAVLGNILGIDDQDEVKALVEGLEEAGFTDMMKEFLAPSRKI